MPANTLDNLRSQVLSLSVPERADLANELIKSLDAPADEGVAEAWDKEIVRRIAQIDSGEAELLGLDEFRRRMRAKIGRPWCELFTYLQPPQKKLLKRPRGTKENGQEFPYAVDAALDLIEDEMVPLSPMIDGAGLVGAKRLILKRCPYVIVVERGWHYFRCCNSSSIS